MSAKRNHRRKYKTPQSHKPDPYSLDATRFLGGQSGSYYGGKRRAALQKKGVKRLVNRTDRHKRKQESWELPRETDIDVKILLFCGNPDCKYSDCVTRFHLVKGEIEDAKGRVLCRHCGWVPKGAL